MITTMPLTAGTARVALKALMPKGGRYVLTVSPQLQFVAAQIVTEQGVLGHVDASRQEFVPATWEEWCASLDGLPGRVVVDRSLAPWAWSIQVDLTDGGQTREEGEMAGNADELERQRSAQNEETHAWRLVAAFGADAPGDSEDRFDYCPLCGTLRRGYHYGGGRTTAAYPQFSFPRNVVLTAHGLSHAGGVSLTLCPRCPLSGGALP